MSPAALALVLVSVCMHAGWNVLGKRNAPSLASFTLAYGAGGAVMLPLVLIGPSLTALPSAFWGWLALSGLCQMLYMGGLAWAYARGDVSVLYPIARALPVVLVPLVSIALLGSRVLDRWDGLGMVLVVAGALCLPLSHPQARRISTYLTPAMGFALLAAAGTVGYSLIDKQALGLMQGAGHSGLTAGAVFMVLQALMTLTWSVPLLALLPAERRRLPALRQQGFTMLIVTGLMMTCTYGLVLIAMALTKEVSYVVALRQLSIPVGVLMGVLWLKEPASRAKAVGTLVMLAGLVLVAL
ncbi:MULTISPECIES: EamA family transporter [Halomonadaceae]|uniref:EamA family transporter n=1 Tax=Halomonadaceae TaxID=28256 RepID=UPI0012F3B411|nr:MULTISPECIES: EamA family transporter [Halomonas]CAD5259960.1 Drug/metabolite transporter [Halomonas sp. 59]CAD5260243.1 Drug/metabolite transporter [Halomonas sp. 113]CAD5274249.1 Drug/metabolite transporter [Halomonas sp. I3]CAD5288435.1 Drug/metabolite transporter [Halomonas sp. 156]VXB38186.1 Drug/metabolite transporter [Halomonas titanicae]